MAKAAAKRKATAKSFIAKEREESFLLEGVLIDCVDVSVLSVSSKVSVGL